MSANDQQPRGRVSRLDQIREERMQSSRGANTGGYVPFDVRVAGFRRQGYTPSEAKRMAQYQTSTAGLRNPLSGQNGQPLDPRLNSGGGSPRGQQAQTRQTQQPQGESFQTPPPGKQQSSGRPRTLSGIEQAQKNYEDRRKEIMAMPEKTDEQKKAKAAKTKAFNRKKGDALKFAESRGWTFDPKKGYSNPTMNDPGYTVHVASKPERGPNAGVPSGGTATFTMPDGSERTISGDQDPAEQFADTRSGQSGGSSSVSATSAPAGAGAPQSPGSPDVPQDLRSRVDQLNAGFEEARNNPIVEDGRLAFKPPAAQESESAESPSPSIEPVPPSDDLEPLPDSINGRQAGAAQGKSYVAPDGKIWQNDGQGGFNVVPAQETKSAAPSMSPGLEQYMRDNPGASQPGYEIKPLGSNSATAAAPISPPTTNKDTRTLATVDQPADTPPENGAFKAPARKVPKAKEVIHQLKGEDFTVNGVSKKGMRPGERSRGRFNRTVGGGRRIFNNSNRRRRD